MLRSTQELHLPVPLPPTVLGQPAPAPFCGPCCAALQAISTHSRTSLSKGRPANSAAVPKGEGEA